MKIRLIQLETEQFVYQGDEQCMN